MYVYDACLFLCLLFGLCGGLWECLSCSAVVKDSIFSLGVLKYVVCLCKGVMDVVFLFVL